MKSPVLLLLFCTALFASDSPEQVFERAAKALSNGDYVSAENGFLQVLKADPNNIGAMGNLGVVYSRSNRTAKAVAIYSRALKLSPHDELLELNIGLAYLKQDDHTRALPFFAEVVAADKNNIQAQELLASCRLYTGDLAPALVELESLRANDLHNTGILYLLGVGYIKAKQPEKAKAVLDELFTAAASPAQANFVLGKTYYDAQRFPEAESYFLKALELDPATPGIGLELAKVYLSERRTDEAIARLKQILTANPADPDANYFLGGALVQDAKYAEGISYLEKARQLTPEAWAVFFYLGKARLALGQAMKAALLLKQAADLNPLEPSVFYQLAKAEKASGREKESIAALEHVKNLRSRGLNREVESLESSGVAGLR